MDEISYTHKLGVVVYLIYLLLTIAVDTKGAILAPNIVNGNLINFIIYLYPHILFFILLYIFWPIVNNSIYLFDSIQDIPTQSSCLR